jgi:hypothetical protein
MLITRKSMFTGVTHTKDLDINLDEMRAREEGALIQDAFPRMSSEDREFFKTGVTAEEWDAVMGEEDTREILRYAFNCS